MYFSVKQVKPCKDYLLHLTFENGEERVFDMKPYLDTGNFKELKKVDMFTTVKVSFDSIQWDNGLDFDPEVLYQKSKQLITK